MDHFYLSHRVVNEAILYAHHTLSVGAVPNYLELLSKNLHELGNIFVIDAQSCWQTQGLDVQQIIAIFDVL